jgi:hypothetical protein
MTNSQNNEKNTECPNNVIDFLKAKKLKEDLELYNKYLKLLEQAEKNCTW